MERIEHQHISHTHVARTPDEATWANRTVTLRNATPHAINVKTYNETDTMQLLAFEKYVLVTGEVCTIVAKGFSFILADISSGTSKVPTFISIYRYRYWIAFFAVYLETS